jgi:hypothetical protein
MLHLRPTAFYHNLEPVRLFQVPKLQVAFPPFALLMEWALVWLFRKLHGGARLAACVYGYA